VDQRFALRRFLDVLEPSGTIRSYEQQSLRGLHPFSVYLEATGLCSRAAAFDAILTAARGVQRFAAAAAADRFTYKLAGH
jgi:hypothetical protein